MASIRVRMSGKFQGEITATTGYGAAVQPSSIPGSSEERRRRGRQELGCEPAPAVDGRRDHIELGVGEGSTTGVDG